MEKQKMINMYKVLGLKLIAQGTKFLQMAFHLIPKQTTRTYIRNLLTSKGVPSNKIMFADNTYFYTDIETMKDIILHDWTDQREYIAESGDCDDFAFSFKSHLQERFGITAIALAREIQITDINTGAPKGYHRANIFIADENNVIKVWFYEPQTDKFVELKNYNELIELTGWKNLLNIFDF